MLPSLSVKVAHQPQDVRLGGSGNATPRAVSSRWVVRMSSQVNSTGDSEPSLLASNVRVYRTSVTAPPGGRTSIQRGPLDSAPMGSSVTSENPIVSTQKRFAAS